MYSDFFQDLEDPTILSPNDSTYYARVSGTTFEKEGIHNDDILVVDRSIDPKKGSLVVACDSTDFRLLRVTEDIKEFDKPIPSNPDLFLWGAVSSVIHKA